MRSRIFLPFLLLACLSLPPGAVAAEPEATQANPLAWPTVIVAPEYPKASAPDRAEVRIEVRGTVTADGDFQDPEFVHEPGDEAFAKAVREVLKFWRFSPAVDDGACIPARSQATLFVWFARKDGKPSVSVSMPAKASQQKGGKLVFRNRDRVNYPRDALAKAVEGTTVLLARVHKAGNIESLAIRSKGVLPSFDVAALNGFQRATFEPFDPADWKGNDVICVEYEMRYCITGGGVAFPNPQCNRD